MSRASQEIEVALLMVSNAPGDLADQIAALVSIGPYRLIARDTLAIRDQYLDTSDRALAARRLALRLRVIGVEELITLKGPSQPTPWGGTERFELEAPWTAQAVADVVEAVREQGITLPAPAPVVASARETIASLGLTVVQDRETSRLPRSVVFAGHPDKGAQAELAIDAVLYHVGPRAIRLHQVEIEAGAPEGPAALQVVRGDLLARYGPVLRPWPYGKLATGEVIERLLRRGLLDEVLTPGGLLTPEAVDRLEARLAERDDRYG